MQKKNEFFFALSSESTLGRQIRGTIKRAEYKKKHKISFCIFEREYLGYILHFRKDSGVEVVQPC